LRTPKSTNQNIYISLKQAKVRKKEDKMNFSEELESEDMEVDDDDELDIDELEEGF
jgi:hypothetical protein